MPDSPCLTNSKKEMASGSQYRFKLVLVSLCVAVNLLMATCWPASSGSSGPGAAAAQGQRFSWNYPRTWVFAVGVLEWQKKSLKSFTTDDRRDLALVNTFRAAGVPEDHIVYLSDKKAKLDTIRDSLTAMMAKTRPGDTLFFYYCGHGWLSNDGTDGFYANYDAGNESYSCWSTNSIVEQLSAFHGSTVFIAADCCHSGSLDKSLRAARPNYQYAFLSSATADENSTGNWTFSQALLDCLQGHRFADIDNDGYTTFGELARYVRDDMKKFEKQNAAADCSPGLDQAFCVARTVTPNEPIPERVEVFWGTKYYPARLLAKNGMQAKIRWISIGFDTPDHDQWVDGTKMRYLDRGTLSTLQALASGSKVEVLWKEKYYPATILQAALSGQYLIHYDGYESSWDEWVATDRIK